MVFHITMLRSSPCECHLRLNQFGNIYFKDEKCLCLPWSKADLKGFVNSKTVRNCSEVWWIMSIPSSGLKTEDEEDLLSVQKPTSLMVWGCISVYGMGSLQIWKQTINAERYIQVLQQHMLPSTTSFWNWVCNLMLYNVHIVSKVSHYYSCRQFVDNLETKVVFLTSYCFFDRRWHQ